MVCDLLGNEWPSTGELLTPASVKTGCRYLWQSMLSGKQRTPVSVLQQTNDILLMKVVSKEFGLLRCAYLADRWAG